MGPGMRVGLGTGIAHPANHPSSPPRVHPSPAPVSPWLMRAESGGLKVVVGLRSVAQLTLSRQISGFQGMTEVYNLENIGRINNHSVIPGNE